MNILTKSLVAGGAIAAAAPLLSYKKDWHSHPEQDRCHFPYLWRPFISNCKERKDSSPIEQSSAATGLATHQGRGIDDGDLYCFYCGRGDGQRIKEEEVRGHSLVSFLSSLLFPKFHKRNKKKKEEERDCVRRSEKPEAAICRSRRLLNSFMLEQGVPGCVVAVMMNGECVWSDGIGLADVENDLPCTSQSGMSKLK